MAYNIMLYHYVPGNSVIHNIHPGIKLIIVLGFCILLFFLRLPALFIVLLAETIFILLSKTRIKQMFCELRKFFLFIIIILLFRAYSSANPVILLRIVPVPSIKGLFAGGHIAIKICMLIFFSLLLTSTTKASQLQDILYNAFTKIPFFPAARLSFIISLTIISIPILLDKFQEVDETRKARCIQSNKNPFYHLFSFALPFLFHILKTADDIACSMEARSYSEKNILMTKTTPLRKKDFISAAICLLIISAALYIECLVPVS